MAGLWIRSLEATAQRHALSVADSVGEVWLNALKMTLVPLVFALIVTGVTSAAGATSAGGRASRAMIWFAALLIVSAALSAIITPALLAVWPSPAELIGNVPGAASAAEAAQGPSIAEFLKNIIPANPVAAAAEGSILQVVVFALAFGFATHRISGDLFSSLLQFFRALQDVMLVIVRWVLWVAPVGVFALSLALACRQGGAAAGALAHYVLVISLVCVAVLSLGYPLAKYGGVPLRKFSRAIVPVQVVALSTQSSLASLPMMIECANDKLNLPPRDSGLVLPLAVAVFRASSPAANLAVAIYLGHLAGIQPSPAQLALAGAVAVLVSLAGVGVASSVTFFVTLSPICMALGVPIEMLPLLIAVEAIPDMFRTAANVTLDLAVASAIGRPATDVATQET